MQTTNISSPATTAPLPVTSSTALPSPPPTPPLPTLSPGNQSSEFYLALLGVGAIVAALWAGKLDAGLASALLGLILSGYPTLRTWLKAQHVDAVADVLSTHLQNGGGAQALATLAGAVDGNDRTDKTNGSNGTSTPLVPAAIVGMAMLLGLSACANTPYYVSGIDGTVDTSKDGSAITGGGLGVTISPNPNFPPPSPRSSAR